MMMEGLGYGINKGSSGIFFRLLCPPCSLLCKQTHTELSGALGLAGGGAPAARTHHYPEKAKVSQTGGANNL